MNKGIDVKDADDVVKVCVILERDSDLNIDRISSVTVLILIVKVFFSKRLPFFFIFLMLPCCLCLIPAFMTFRSE